MCLPGGSWQIQEGAAAEQHMRSDFRWRQDLHIFKEPKPILSIAWDAPWLIVLPKKIHFGEMGG